MGEILAETIEMIEAGWEEDEVRIVLEVEFEIWQPAIREEVIEQAYEIAEGEEND